MIVALLVMARGGLLGQDIEIAPMKADLQFLTSDALAGRQSLEPGAAAAAEYIAVEFRKAGLQPGNGDSYLQQFALAAYRADPSVSTLTVNIQGVVMNCRRGKRFSGRL